MDDDSNHPTETTTIRAGGKQLRLIQRRDCVGSNHGELGKIALCRLLMGKIGLRKR
jgi:hypothetical protein